MSIVADIRHRIASFVSPTPLADPENRALTSGSLWPSFGVFAANRALTSLSPRAAFTIPGVSAAVQLLSQEVATLPLKVFNVEGGGHSEARRHPAYNLLRWTPNPLYTARQWRETAQIHICLFGNSFTEIVFDTAGRPRQLWLLEPEKVGVFTDQDGRPVHLGDYFDGARPVLLTMNYTNCPMLCSMQLNGLTDGLRGLDTDTGWTPGGNFVVLTVSIDHEEKPERAKQTHDRYIRDLGRPAAASGWHFLTGSQENIRALTDAIGFVFKKIPGTNDYAHKAALMVLTPEGKISRYLSGIEYEPKTLRLSMIESSEGKVGSAKDKFLLFWNCYRYDPEKQRYTVAAEVIMRIGAALTVLILGSVLGFFWWREWKKAKADRQEEKVEA